jgi:asparagine synthase (glutamine-hydrolysing)
LPYNARRVCGIYGVVSASPLRHPEVLDGMGESLRHRGPDGRAVLTRPYAAIGTERLRIIDLHERADQPFASPGGEVWLQANGEIYNSAEIRSRFAGYPFRSSSDIESVLPLYLERGASAVEQLDGMFAIAVWDDRDRSLLLARDRAGEKPLFYTRAAGEIAFASEIQCLLRHPEVSRELDPGAIAAYLELGYVPEPLTLFRSIRRVPAGAWIRFSDAGEEVVRYWRPEEIPIQKIEPRLAIAETRRLIEAAVVRQVRADVPVGVFISGGLDSAILATLASREIGLDRVYTFSAAFAESSYDESAEAAVIARRMRTRHLTVPADEPALREALIRVTAGLAEPLADPAILPTFLLARAAREQVKVILSGEGADELFGGYPTYIGHRLAPAYARLPSILRTALRRAVLAFPPSPKKVTLEFLLKRFVTAAEMPWIERHLTWFGTGLAAGQISHLEHEPLTEYSSLVERDSVSGAMLLDYRNYLRDNLLVKVDRATMLSSVEARAPYLDRDVTAFALSLPPEIRLHGLTTKWVLKKAAEAWVDRDVIHRRKRGLSVPVATWINRGLRSEVDRLLEPGRLRRRGLLREERVSELLAAHRSGRANHARPLWALLMLESWLEQWAG